MEGHLTTKTKNVQKSISVEVSPLKGAKESCIIVRSQIVSSLYAGMVKNYHNNTSTLPKSRETIICAFKPLGDLSRISKTPSEWH